LQLGCTEPHRQKENAQCALWSEKRNRDI